MADFYLAWISGPEVAFDPVAHARMDEDIFDYSLEHKEGGFATLTLTIADPGVSLLDPSRSQWAYFAEDSEAGVVARFKGRLVVVPNKTADHEIQVTLIARPEDFQSQKVAAATALNADAESWDPIWIDPQSRDDPDAALTARTENWFIDPVTLVLSTSDNIVGEAGLIVLGESEVYYDNASLTYGQAPATAIDVTATVNWTQSVAGRFETAPFLIDTFEAAGFPIANMIGSYTGQDLIDQWPVPDTNIGGGWTVIDSNVSDRRNLIPQAVQDDSTITVWAAGQTTTNDDIGVDTVEIDVSLGPFVPSLIVGYAAERSYSEVVTFRLNAGLQPILAADGSAQEALKLTLSSNDTAQPVDAGGAMPISDVRRRSFMASDRGHRSMRYLVKRARASLIDVARCVTAVADVDFARRFDVTLRHSLEMPHPDAPGGIVQGKVIDWRESGSGDSGDFTFTVTLGCCPGTGGSIAADAGTGVYAQDGYMQNGYQLRAGATTLVAGDVTFTEYAVTPSDDGIDFLAFEPARMINSIIVTNGPQAQATALQRFYPDQQTALDAYKKVATKICMDFKSVTGGPFTTSIPVTVSDLVIPKQIDFAAA